MGAVGDRRHARLRRGARLARTVAVVAVVAWAADAWVISAGEAPPVRSAVAGPIGLRPASTPSTTPPTPAPTPPTTTAPPPTRRPTTTAAPKPTTAPASTQGPFRVGTTVLHFADDSRAQPARLGGNPPRVLDTVVHYPVAGDPAAPPVAEARAAPGRRFPLVVFAHGFDVMPTTYDELTMAWARAGYVVASPALPGTVEGPGADESDLPNQVADLAFEISAMEQTASAATGPLAGALDPSRVAVAGHSDGAETVAGLALDRCCLDRRVRASIVLAGAELTLPGGSYAGPGHAPTLIAQGDADQVDNPYYDLELYTDLAPPKWFMAVTGGDHLSPFASPAGRWAAVGDATVAFLDWKLKGLPGAQARFRAAATTPGVTRLIGVG